MTVQTVPAVTGTGFPVVDNVSATVYKIPTDAPEADGTLAWSKTTLPAPSVILNTGAYPCPIRYTFTPSTFSGWFTRRS